MVVLEGGAPPGQPGHWTSTSVPPQPLDSVGALATLLAVTGTLTVQDAANAVHLTPSDLEHEALAWGAAAGANP